MPHPAMVTIIDDDESVRDATASLVRSLGLAAATFDSAEAFLGSPCLKETACIITDVQMPGMGGVALQAELRAMQRETPVIFITAFPEDRIRQKVTAAGAFGFLGKPFEGDALIACIDRALTSQG